jgi:hypothetical protein
MPRVFDKLIISAKNMLTCFLMIFGAKGMYMVDSQIDSQIDSQSINQTRNKDCLHFVLTCLMGAGLTR